MPLNIIFEGIPSAHTVTVVNSNMSLPVEDVNDGGCDMAEPAEHSEIHTEQVKILIHFTFQ